jgi:hypothetical protein
MPTVVWDALEAGSDSPRDKTFERPAYFEVAAVLPRVSQELGLFKSVAEAAQRMAENIARDILQMGVTHLNISVSLTL